VVLQVVRRRPAASGQKGPSSQTLPRPGSAAGIRRISAPDRVTYPRPKSHSTLGCWTWNQIPPAFTVRDNGSRSDPGPFGTFRRPLSTAWTPPASKANTIDSHLGWGRSEIPSGPITSSARLQESSSSRSGPKLDAGENSGGHKIGMFRVHVSRRSRSGSTRYPSNGTSLRPSAKSCLGFIRPKRHSKPDAANSWSCSKRRTARPNSGSQTRPLQQNIFEPKAVVGINNLFQTGSSSDTRTAFTPPHTISRQRSRPLFTGSSAPVKECRAGGRWLRAGTAAR